MSDKIARAKLMLTQADHLLEAPAPDLAVVEKLISDALSLVVELREPHNPYQDRALRPGLNQGDPDVL